MTEIMPFPENNYETVLLDRPFGVPFFGAAWTRTHFNADARWASACRRFIGGNTIRGEAEAIESGCQKMNRGTP